MGAQNFWGTMGFVINYLTAFDYIFNYELLIFSDRHVIFLRFPVVFYGNVSCAYFSVFDEYISIDSYR